MAKFIETGELGEGGMGSEGWTGMKLQEEEKVLERDGGDAGPAT